MKKLRYFAYTVIGIYLTCVLLALLYFISPASDLIKICIWPSSYINPHHEYIYHSPHVIIYFVISCFLCFAAIHALYLQDYPKKMGPWGAFLVLGLGVAGLVVFTPNFLLFVSQVPAIEITPNAIIINQGYSVQQTFPFDTIVAFYHRTDRHRRSKGRTSYYTHRAEILTSENVCVRLPDTTCTASEILRKISQYRPLEWVHKNATDEQHVRSSRFLNKYIYKRSNPHFYLGV